MDSISEQEKQDIRELLATIFGDDALTWNINLRVLQLFGELLQSSGRCSRYMDKVPRPYYFGSSIKWASKQVRTAVIRHLRNGGRHYLICLRAAGLSRKTDFVLASRGL